MVISPHFLIEFRFGEFRVIFIFVVGRFMTLLRGCMGVGSALLKNHCSNRMTTTYEELKARREREKRLFEVPNDYASRAGHFFPLYFPSILLQKTLAHWRSEPIPGRQPGMPTRPSKIAYDNARFNSFVCLPSAGRRSLLRHMRPSTSQCLHISAQP